MRTLFNKSSQPPNPRLSDAPGDEVDRELAQQMADGSGEALARFVDRHVGYVYRHLQRRLGPGNDGLIDEVARATFVAAFRRMRPYVRESARTPMRLWLVRLAGRELGRRRKAMMQASDPANVDAESEELVTLREAIAVLPRRQGAAVCMALFDGMSSEEIAGALGVRQARAMRLLRNGLRRTGSKLALAHAEVS